MSSNKHLAVGRIVKTHGVKGQVEIYVLTDKPQRFKAGATFKLIPPRPEIGDLTLEEVRYKKDRVLARLVNIGDLESARALIGTDLVVPVSEGDKPDHSHWHHDIIGCAVDTVTGDRLGCVSEIIRTGANDVYVVDGDREYLIPATKEVIKSIDIENRVIVIAPLPGLLEL